MLMHTAVIAAGIFNFDEPPEKSPAPKPPEFKLGVEPRQHLKEIGLACLMHENEAKRFPDPQRESPERKPLLSWRVTILPWVGEEKLYKEFKLDEPWDSEHNKKLILKMPLVYRHPQSPKLNDAYKTRWVLPIGDGAVYQSMDRLGPDIRAIRDGTSNTILVVEADEQHAVEWTRPKDHDYDRKKPGAGLGANGAFLVLLAEGSVYRLDAAAEGLEAAFTPRSREDVSIRSLWARKKKEPSR